MQTRSGFISEEQLVNAARRHIRESSKALKVDVRTRTEVKAPGGVPDMVMFRKIDRSVHYVITVEFKLRDWR